MATRNTRDSYEKIGEPGRKARACGDVGGDGGWAEKKLTVIRVKAFLTRLA